MNILFVILLCGVPLANLLFRELDLWHSQGNFIQVMILILFSCSFFVKKNIIKVKNISLGLLVFWIGLNTLFYNYASMKNGGYTIALYAFFNFLCCVLFYQLCVQYLNREKITKILKYLKYVIIFTLLYCVIQQFKLDQFFSLMSGVNTSGSAIVGFIGNTAHLSAYLAICSPLLFGRKLENFLSVILLWIILLFFTWFGIAGEAVSITGIVVGLAVFSYYAAKKYKFNVFWIYLIVGSGVLFLTIKFISNPKIIEFFSFNGRIGYMKYYFSKLSNDFIIGKGLNAVNLVARKSELYPAIRHLHNDYFQGLFELGLIGLILIINCIWEFFKVKVKEDKTTITLKAMFLGFCIACLFIYSAHVWLTALLGIFAYSGIYCIKNEELK